MFKGYAIKLERVIIILRNHRLYITRLISAFYVPHAYSSEVVKIMVLYNRAFLGYDT